MVPKRKIANLPDFNFFLGWPLCKYNAFSYIANTVTTIGTHSKVIIFPTNQKEYRQKSEISYIYVISFFLIVKVDNRVRKSSHSPKHSLFSCELPENHKNLQSTE